ncbi:MAG: ABC transporter ATP-binding protein [Rickettsiaceae bacterium]|nr:MAG: ABC transporter ATP-binding protein [Rickettsiaceae bacterium]
MPITRNLSFIIDCLKSFKLLITCKLLINVIWAIDTSLRPYLVKLMLDTASSTSDHTYKTLLFLTLSYIGITILLYSAFRCHDYISIKLNPKLRKSIVLDIMDKMMNHSHSTFQNYFSGSLGNKVKDLMTSIPALVQLTIDQFFSHFLALIIAIYTLANINLNFAMCFGLWAMIFIISSYKLSLATQALATSAAECRSKVIGKVVDSFTNMINIRLFGATRHESSILSTSLDEYASSERRKDWYLLKMFSFQSFLLIIYQGSCLFWLVHQLYQGLLTSGDFALVLMINISLMHCLWDLSRDFADFAERYGDVMQGLNVALLDIEIKDIEDAKDIQIDKREIVFDNVCFGYTKEKRLFDNLSVKIYSGQKVGLVGYSGSGKSTFINLILRLFELSSGQILIDGQNISQVKQNSLRQSISMIPQDPILFHRSLLDNIRYSKDTASDEDVVKAAKSAHAHEFIINLPERYNSTVGERGIKLSGGQRQRIAIARGFLKNAPIIILDEATSQLDSITENYIQESLLKLIENKTALIIAHRLSTLLHVDRILVFHTGKIVEDGTHEQLMSLNGHYKKLWDAQVGGFIPS